MRFYSRQLNEHKATNICLQMTYHIVRITRIFGQFEVCGFIYKPTITLTICLGVPVSVRHVFLDETRAQPNPLSSVTVLEQVHVGVGSWNLDFGNGKYLKKTKYFITPSGEEY